MSYPTAPRLSDRGRAVLAAAAAVTAARTGVWIAPDGALHRVDRPCGTKCVGCARGRPS